MPLEAAELLRSDAIEVEVVDPRTLVPLDLEMIAESVDRTHHLIVAQEASNFGSWGATLVAHVLEQRLRVARRAAVTDRWRRDADSLRKRPRAGVASECRADRRRRAADVGVLTGPPAGRAQLCFAPKLFGDLTPRPNPLSAAYVATGRRVCELR